MKAIFFAFILALGLATAAPVKDVKCDICVKVIKYVDDWLASGAGHKEIEVLIKKFCEMVGPEYEPICDAVLEMEIEQLIDWVEHFQPKEVCHKLGLCPAVVAPTIDGCATCEKVITFVEDWMKSGAGKEEIKVLLEMLCKLFPQYEQVCDQLIEMEIDQLIEWITQYKPQQVCQMLGLCPKTTTNDACAICKRVIGFIDDWLESGAGKAEVKALVEALCAYMGPEYKEICDTILEMEIEQLIAWIEQYKPEQVCQLLSLCPKTAPVKKTGCEICKLVIGLVEFWLEDQKTLQEIEKLIADLCAVMGPEYAGICNAILDQEIEELIKWIETSETPEVVCQQLKQCPKQVAPLHLDKCTICKLAYDALKEFLTNPRTEQEIITFIDQICNWFPKYQAVCDELVAFGVMELAEMIKQYDDVTVCKMIHLCQ
jgi:hypothetical protein